MSILSEVFSYVKVAKTCTYRRVCFLTALVLLHCSTQNTSVFLCTCRTSHISPMYVGRHICHTNHLRTHQTPYISKPIHPCSLHTRPDHSTPQQTTQITKTPFCHLDFGTVHLTHMTTLTTLTILGTQTDQLDHSGHFDWSKELSRR